MATTNKRLLIFESRGDLNRCTPCRGDLTNTTYMLPMPVHVRPAYASCGWSPYVATFHESSTGLDGCTALEKNWSWLHLSARLSGSRDLPQFLSQHSHRSSALKPSTCRWPTTRLTGPISPTCDRYVQYLLMGTYPSVLNRYRRGLPGPYHWHAIGTFNTCSRVPTPWSLTNTDGGYHIENLRIVTALSPPFPSEDSTDPPNGPAWSQIIQH
jgi:hypothetical protein